MWSLARFLYIYWLKGYSQMWVLIFVLESCPSQAANQITEESSVTGSHSIEKTMFRSNFSMHIKCGYHNWIGKADRMKHSENETVLQSSDSCQEQYHLHSQGYHEINKCTSSYQFTAVIQPHLNIKPLHYKLWDEAPPTSSDIIRESHDALSSGKLELKLSRINDLMCVQIIIGQSKMTICINFNKIFKLHLQNEECASLFFLIFSMFYSIYEGAGKLNCYKLFCNCTFFLHILFINVNKDAAFIVSDMFFLWLWAYKKITFVIMILWWCLHTFITHAIFLTRLERTICSGGEIMRIGVILVIIYLVISYFKKRPTDKSIKAWIHHRIKKYDYNLKI